MTFGESSGWCGWDWYYLFLNGIDQNIRESGIPKYVFAMFQGRFAIITPVLIAGAFARRFRFRGYCIFIALWSLLVYNPLAHWVWGGGFLTGKAIDFAGGTVIHIFAGVGVSIVYAAAVTIMLIVLVDKLVGFRLGKEAEMGGMDHCQRAAARKTGGWMGDGKVFITHLEDYIRIRTGKHRDSAI